MRNVGDFGSRWPDQRHDDEQPPRQPGRGSAGTRLRRDVEAGGAALGGATRGDAGSRGDDFGAGEWDGAERRAQDFQQRLRGALDDAADDDPADHEGNRGEFEGSVSTTSLNEAALTALFQPLSTNLPMTRHAPARHLGNTPRREANGLEGHQPLSETTFAIDAFASDERQGPGANGVVHTRAPATSMPSPSRVGAAFDAFDADAFDAVARWSSAAPSPLRILAQSSSATQAADLVFTPFRLPSGGSTSATLDPSVPPVKVEDLAQRIAQNIDADIRPAGPLTISLALDPGIDGSASVTVTLTAGGLDVVLDRWAGTQMSDSLAGAAHELVSRLQKRFPRSTVRVLAIDASSLDKLEAQETGPPTGGSLA